MNRSVEQSQKKIMYEELVTTLIILDILTKLQNIFCCEHVQMKEKVFGLKQLT